VDGGLQGAARQIHDDKAKAAALFKGLSQAQRQDLAFAYQFIYGTSLVDDLKSDLGARDFGEALFAFTDKPAAQRAQEFAAPKLVEAALTNDRTFLGPDGKPTTRIDAIFRDLPAEHKEAKALATRYKEVEKALADPSTPAAKKKELEAEKTRLAQQFTDLQKAANATALLQALDPEGWKAINPDRSFEPNKWLLLSPGVSLATQGLVKLLDTDAYRSMDTRSVNALKRRALEAFRRTSSRAAGSCTPPRWGAPST
jgi:hypothetical protein